MADFKDRIRNLRINEGLTQEELAKELGISRSTVGMYETGKREADYETLELIADFFNVDMNYLIGWVDSPHSWEQIANDNGICPPNDYEGDPEDWIKMKRATEDDYEKEEKEFVSYIMNDDQFRSLAASYKLLNIQGRQKAYDYVSDLAEQPKYLDNTSIQRFPSANNQILNAAQKRTDIEIPEGTDTSEDDIMKDDNF